MSGKRKSKTKKQSEEIRRLTDELAISRDLCDVLRNDYNNMRKQYSDLENTVAAERKKHSYMRSLYTAVSAHAQSLHALTELIK